MRMLYNEMEIVIGILLTAIDMIFFYLCLDFFNMKSSVMVALGFVAFVVWALTNCYVFRTIVIPDFKKRINTKKEN